MGAKGCAKTGGRTKGTPNKVKGNVVDTIMGVFNGFPASAITEDLRAMSPKDRVSCLIRLAEFIVPKAKQEIEVTNTKNHITFAKLQSELQVIAEGEEVTHG